MVARCCSLLHLRYFSVTKWIQLRRRKSKSKPQLSEGTKLQSISPLLPFCFTKRINRKERKDRRGARRRRTRACTLQRFPLLFFDSTTSDYESSSSLKPGSAWREREEYRREKQLFLHSHTPFHFHYYCSLNHLTSYPNSDLMVGHRLCKEVGMYEKEAKEVSLCTLDQQLMQNRTIVPLPSPPHILTRDKFEMTTLLITFPLLIILPSTPSSMLPRFKR